LAVSAAQDWAFDAFAVRAVDGAGGSGHQRGGCWFGALTDDLQCPVAAFQAKVFDVGSAGF